MKIKLTGQIHKMAPFASGSPSEDILVYFQATAGDGTMTGAHITLQIPIEEAEKLHYKQTLHVSIETED